MLGDMLLRPFRNEKSRAKKTRCKRSEEEMEEERHVYSVPFHNPPLKNASLSLKSNKNHGNVANLKRMTSKASNFSDLIQRVTASCLLHPLAGVSRPEDISAAEYEEDYDPDNAAAAEEFKISSDWIWEEQAPPRVMELEMLMNQVFDTVSLMKRAYVSLQESHCPWDPDKMRIADVAVVAEMRRLGLLRERFRRSASGGGRGERWGVGEATLLLEVVAPYEAAVEELKKEVKLKQAEIDNLTEKLKTATSFDRMTSKSKRRVNCTTQVGAAPAVELFESTMGLVKEASKAYTSLLLSLMRSANWDIAAAVRSIEAATTNNPTTTTTFTDSNHAKYALESYVNRKIFQGFDHEAFYMDGTLSSILHPDQYRRDCFTQYKDMKAMDPVELLSIMPTCSFGNFCFKKYLSIVHPKMEESLFGDLEQRREVLDGRHPRSEFYGEFLGLAKAVWLLHLLAFSLDPPPGHFEAGRGAEFQPHYMESVVRVSGSSGGSKGSRSMFVGFPVSPGFKLGNGSIIKARVYLVPNNS